MAAVLGIDAAWTEKNPSGFALIEKFGPAWRLRAAAPNIEEFASLCGLTVPGDGAAGFGLDCAERMLAGSLPDLVAVDMPLSLERIERRRKSDKAVSRAFGAAQCATHSPSKDRPGAVSADLLTRCRAKGYTLITSQPAAGVRSLAEVYPHPALLGLLNVRKRFPYKISKTTTYWKKTESERRLTNVKDSLRTIVRSLEGRISGVADRIGDGIEKEYSFSALKPVEDMIDAIVSAWVGITILEGVAKPFGDENSAIWIPLAAMHAAAQTEAGQ